MWNHIRSSSCRMTIWYWNRLWKPEYRIWMGLLNNRRHWKTTLLENESFYKLYHPISISSFSNLSAKYYVSYVSGLSGLVWNLN